MDADYKQPGWVVAATDILKVVPEAKLLANAIDQHAPWVLAIGSAKKLEEMANSKDASSREV